MNHLLFATRFLVEATEPVGVPALVPIAIGVILLLLFWWGLNRNTIPQAIDTHADDHHGDDHAPQMRNEAHSAHQDVDVAAVATESVPVRATAVPLTEPDDLKKVEGIGPKIEGILHDAGIRTFADLGNATVTQLEKIVREDAGIRVAYPDTWPEQAKLASAGEWAKLEQLQDELKGGRRA